MAYNNAFVDEIQKRVGAVQVLSSTRNIFRLPSFLEFMPRAQLLAAQMGAPFVQLNVDCLALVFSQLAVKVRGKE